MRSITVRVRELTVSNTDRICCCDCCNFFNIDSTLVAIAPGDSSAAISRGARGIARATTNASAKPTIRTLAATMSMDERKCNAYHPRMPLIRCEKCGQAYDVPGAIAVHLPNSIATCQCGEWLAGSKAAVLARLLNPDEVKESDLTPYKTDRAEEAPAPKAPLIAPGKPRSLRVIARSGGKSIHRVFTIGQHPLWIGRKGCHIDLDEADLDIRHCSITLQGDQLVVRDADSHMGTFLDGQRISEAAMGDGVHVLRAGAALVSVEPTDEEGMPVQPTRLRTTEMLDESMLGKKIR